MVEPAQTGKGPVSIGKGLEVCNIAPALIFSAGLILSPPDLLRDCQVCAFTEISASSFTAKKTTLAGKCSITVGAGKTTIDTYFIDFFSKRFL